VRCLVTGVAGFIGSSLAEELIRQGHEVVGVDSFVPYYPRAIKEANLHWLRTQRAFRLIENDIVTLFADESAEGFKLLEGVDVVFHQAAQAGVRASWGTYFESYCHNNVLATQKLLEACKGREGLKFVYASSSSVYGETGKFPMEEDDLPVPVSPYGVTKLAAEHLVRLYTANYGLHTVSLRYFTVYGPRQRPDMAFHRIIRAALTGSEFVLFGTGEQTRDFTYISDIVAANIAAAQNGQPGGVYNLGGGSQVSMNQVISLIEEITQRKLNVRRASRERGDVTHTGASVERARRDLNFSPKVSLREGLETEVCYIRDVVLPLGV